MYSVKQDFDFVMMLGCGIPAVEMLGTEDDLRKSTSKLKVLRTLLKPIEDDLGLSSTWWVLAEEVFKKLLATYQGSPNVKWWSHIMDYETEYSSSMLSHPSYFYINTEQWLIKKSAGIPPLHLTLSLSQPPSTFV